MVAAISKIILILMMSAPNARIVKDKTFREEIAAHIVRYAEEYEVDPYILTLWIKRESSFRVGVVAKSSHKEYGLGQVHGVARRVCESTGIKLHSAKGQIHCTALLFQINRQRCGGDEKRGLYRYLSGRCSGTPAAKRQYRHRMRELDRALSRIDQTHRR